MIEIRTRQQTWTQVSREDARQSLTEAVWIYHYDLIQTPPDRMEILDLAIPAFLDAPPNFKKLLSSLDGREDRLHIQTKLARITEALRQIPQHLDLWDWSDNRENRANLRTLLSECRMTDYGVARIFKMLHLKRPQLIPVIDDWAREAWAETFSQNWTIDELVEITFAMGRELSVRRETLNEIRELAAELGWPYTSLSRLRLYDIIFWAYEYKIRIGKASTVAGLRDTGDLSPTDR